MTKNLRILILRLFEEGGASNDTSPILSRTILRVESVTNSERE